MSFFQKYGLHFQEEGNQYWSKKNRRQQGVTKGFFYDNWNTHTDKYLFPLSMVPVTTGLDSLLASAPLAISFFPLCLKFGGAGPANAFQKQSH